MNKSNETALYEIFLKFVDGKKLEALWKEGADLPLTGEAWDLDAVDMTYLFLEIEKTFDISINEGQIRDYAFNTVTGIRGILYSSDSKI